MTDHIAGPSVNNCDVVVSKVNNSNNIVDSPAYIQSVAFFTLFLVAEVYCFEGWKKLLLSIERGESTTKSMGWFVYMLLLLSFC
jgi:hypothetical protein